MYNFNLIYSKINEYNIKDNLTIVMEATNIYHKAPKIYFKGKDYHFIVFNSLIKKEITNAIRKIINNIILKKSITDRNYTKEDCYTKLNKLSRQYNYL